MWTIIIKVEKSHFVYRSLFSVYIISAALSLSHFIVVAQFFVAKDDRHFAYPEMFLFIFEQR